MPHYSEGGASSWTQSDSTAGAPIYGGWTTQQAFEGWLSVWRDKYKVGVWNAGLPDPWESLLPEDLKGIDAKVVVSSGGVAGGIVTEGMGYGLMVEGFLAARGSKKALDNGLGLAKSWLAMVNGPGDVVQPFAGGANTSDSATKLKEWPYGVSAVQWSHEGLGPAGVPAWKFPLNKSDLSENMGSATDGDQDAILGMIYLAEALGYPKDFVDMVIRTIIAFTSADLGFPDLYRTLPGGEVIYVPKLGSMWGGLLPPHGKFKTKQQPWCYSPGYFAPAHFRTFRDFVTAHWQVEHNEYLPRFLDGSPTSMQGMTAALDSAVTAGYNILRLSSCPSGSVSNWVGVKAPCKHDDELNCEGVPWAHTPYVGAEGGECSESGTHFGAFGPDASRAAWRIAMDYVLYAEESDKVKLYDREGQVDYQADFGARQYLNMIVTQYNTGAKCDGGVPGSCMKDTRSPYRLASAFDVEMNATKITCDGVPNAPESWWAGFMAYPTFTAFVAPHRGIGTKSMSNWMDTFASICDFSSVNLEDFSLGGKPHGKICLTSYFESSQAVISTMIMAGKLRPLKPYAIEHNDPDAVFIMKDEDVEVAKASKSLATVALPALAVLMMVLFATFVLKRGYHSSYSMVHGKRSLSKIASAPLPIASSDDE